MMTLIVYIAALAVAGLLWKRGMRRPLLAIGLPLLAFDGLLNMVCRQSVRRTLSGEAWAHRHHRLWGWCHRWIDWLFAVPFIAQVDHCRIQYEREERFGGWWGAWLNDWRGGSQWP